MLPNFDRGEMPRALQAMQDRARAGAGGGVSMALPRRTFLKLTGAGGLALGASRSSRRLRPTTRTPVA